MRKKLLIVGKITIIIIISIIILFLISHFLANKFIVINSDQDEIIGRAWVSWGLIGPTADKIIMWNLDIHNKSPFDIKNLFFINLGIYDDNNKLICKPPIIIQEFKERCTENNENYDYEKTLSSFFGSKVDVNKYCTLVNLAARIDIETKDVMGIGNEEEECSEFYPRGDKNYILKFKLSNKILTTSSFSVKLIGDGVGW